MFKKSAPLRNLLRERVTQLAPEKVKIFKDFKAQHGEKVLTEVKMKQVLGGMRGIPGLFYETSKLDANKGILLRNRNLFELCDTLKYKGSEEPLPESLLWFLFTGEVPNEKQTEFVINDLKERALRMDFKPTHDLLNSLPADLHPMTQLSMGVLNLQKQSKFAEAYRNGTPKSQYWETYFEDSMNLIAVLPRIASVIFNNVFHNRRPTANFDSTLNYTENFCNMIGYGGHQGVLNYFSHYLVLHSDHEGGNVSAHASTLVSSALSDPYYSYSAGLNGLAGPLHGLANQEVLRWLLKCRETLGNEPSDQALEDYCKKVLASGSVIPGYGHAVLREVDPRYTIQIQIGDKQIPEDPLFKLVKQCLRVIPPVLKATGKVQNPWPNVDASSGVLLHHYGITQFDFYTVIFGVSRALGVLPTLTWNRIYGLPIERPGSVTLDWLKERV